ncbi:shikimate dehydrogenase [Arboricoccus pini]|uniref:Shikimate dehydrogenase (NADP(+)) n=1 Tax=Arboricoccus pini TaxID=1963835 RepID=A0A212R3B0_9PROT|nr:shikimate dehydrogenase [Arboricoccus pini]SNB66524.1 shikimate dehydrogenase [Arboricoccus pini]
MLISGRARLAGVMGWPIAHSLSPLLHGHWFERHAIDGSYIPLPVVPADLDLLFQALPKAGFRGWNVTLPHKERAFALVDRLTPTAERIGAVNTVLVDTDGTLIGDNTDGHGFTANLDDQAPGWQERTQNVILLGTGGAARGVAAALYDRGLRNFRLINRTLERARLLESELRRLGTLNLEIAPWKTRDEALADGDLLVQCTSLGMEGHEPLALDVAALPPHAVVADLVYRPLETDLLARARARNLRTVDGLGMLIHQAVPGFVHWGGQKPLIDATTRLLMRNALGV